MFSYDEKDSSEELINQVAASIAKAIPEANLDTENVKFVVGDEKKEEVWVECTNCSYGIAVCPYCHGNWETALLVSEEKTCESCLGTGTVTITESYTVREYNGTPCHICGDVGTVDDGKHGGKRAICGECMGYGASHSVGSTDRGSYNGDYANYAFDDKVITNEHSETCPACNGTGKTGKTHYDPCEHCSYGEILCPVCNGRGGHFE